MGRPIVAIGPAVVAVREGRAALRGDTRCAPVHLDDPDRHHERGGRDEADACGRRRLLLLLNVIPVSCPA